MHIQIGARSDVGMVRQSNEDSFGVDAALGLMILCDGMGGMAAGEVASKLGVEAILEHCRQAAKNPQLPVEGEYKKEFSAWTNRLASGIRIANRAICEAGEADASNHGMGSTVVAAWIVGNVLSIAHVGDSRIYLLRDGNLRQLTDDHSLVMEQVRLGLLSSEEAERSAMANVIVRALGADPEVQVDLDELWLKEGDQVLLCSDGLTRKVADPGIGQMLSKAKSAQEASDCLVLCANDSGGEDNITVIVARLQPTPFGRSWWKGLVKSISGGASVWLS